MNHANYRISLDIHDACSQVHLMARKMETGRSIYATLTESGRPYLIADGCNAEFVCLRPNGKKLKNACVIENNTIRYDLTKETVITTGIAQCELRLTDATGELLASPRFQLEVWATIYTEGDAVDSEVANMSTVKSANPGYAEVFMWSDGNPDNEDRVGYFVGEDMDRAAAMVRICDSTSNIRGVTVAAPGFASNAPGERYDENSALRPQYCYVCLLGFAPVIDNGTCAVNGRCRPGDDGTAVPDDSGGGYLVVERLDETHVLILMEQAADMMIRLENQLEERFGAAKKIFRVTIGTTWSGTAAPYTQQIAVGGILESDNPFTDLVAAAGDIPTDEEEEAYSQIRRVKTADGSITVYAREKTAVPVTIRMEEHRLGAGNASDGAQVYTGAYEVTPKLQVQTLRTGNKMMKKNVTVEAIPYHEEENRTGGKTVYIGEE